MSEEVISISFRTVAYTRYPHLIFTASMPHLDAGQRHWSTVYVCPECGTAWAERRVVTDEPMAYTTASAPCTQHGGVLPLSEHDLDYMLHSEVRTTLSEAVIFNLAERILRDRLAS
jgi:hypothetical protein